MKLNMAQLWGSYRAAVVPSDASLGQLVETRRAFYAGASGVFFGLLACTSEGSEATDDDEEMMKSVEAELEAFADLARAGRDVAEMQRGRPENN